MKHLIIYAHPNAASLNFHLKQTVAETLKQQNHEVVIRNLYDLNFNPILSLEDMSGQHMGEVSKDVKKEQEYISWAEHITLIYPIWWTGMPAIMKGYIDRVFSYGFAYRYDAGIQKGLLKKKQTTIINTHGKSQAEYESIGMDKALSLTSDTGIFKYCGLEVAQHFFFDQADRPSPERIQEWMEMLIAAYQI
ncbi:NAD(P)H-dependent oxidoreductase [Zobellia barbeyronii]|uniref:NAD(P)H-dependent oxidoreductase n=1 Tax=Zobellia barbeyronii TaxID=2748009 RepID=A0ABS5WHE5_9FLAO|nr:NAD(P)H-dependent oxidoreductase [Zobellia barbeyronii]MBT2162250.1 NAD(P)H-dependent oxidoreductase [Zobellia barbeyronii]